MKKILMVGDSNGFGEWGRANFNETRYRKDYKPQRYVNPNVSYGCSHPGLTVYLDDLGYAMLNASIPAGSNFQALHQAEKILFLCHPFNGNNNSVCFTNPDIIIWKLTEPLRDVRYYKEEPADNPLGGGSRWYGPGNTSTRPNANTSWDYWRLLVEDAATKVRHLDDMNRLLMQIALDEMSGICNYLGKPLIIIEGLSSTLGLEVKCKHVIIKDWFQRFLPGKMPIICSARMLDYSAKHLVEKEEWDWEQDRLNQMLAECAEYTDWLRQQPERFPDNCHMSRNELKILAGEIDQVIKDNNL